MTVAKSKDGSTYLKPGLLAWGWDPSSSMTKFIGLTKSLGLVKHKQKAQLIFSNSLHTKCYKGVTNPLLSSDANTQILKYGRIPHDVISFSVRWTVFSFILLELWFFIKITKSIYCACLTKNPAGFRSSYQFPSVFKKVTFVVVVRYISEG